MSDNASTGLDLAGLRSVADHADKLTHLPATVIAPDLRALLDDREHHDG